MLEIEIIETNVIDGGGIEVFARAWEDGKPLGFGDGTVEIERFRYFDPPVLVQDDAGDVVVKSGDPFGTPVEVRYKEDPEEAMMQMLERSIRLTKKDGSKIISGKRGSTVTTFAPSLDGAVGSRSANFATVRSDTGNDLRANTNAGQIVQYVGVGYYAATGSACNSDRGFLVFDTSSIDDTDTLDSAVLTLTANFKSNTDNDGFDYMSIVDCTLDSDVAITAGDWDSGGTTKGSNDIDIGDITTDNSTGHDFTLNATGESWVDFTGKTQFCIKSGNDIDNHIPSGTNGNRVGFNAVDYTGTANDPVLTITHSAGGSSTSIKSIAGVAQANIKSMAGVTAANSKSIAGVSNV